MLDNLSEFCRITLYEEEGDGAFSLSGELKKIQLYLDIEAIRLGDYLQVSMDIEKGVEDIIIPPLLLQPLVENAVKFGKMASPESLRVVVRAGSSAGRLHLSVSNSGRWVEREGSDNVGSKGIGLSNLRERLELRYHADYHLTIDKGDAGVIVSLDVPTQYSQKG